MARTRVLIADDHPLIIEGITAALKRLGFNVVGQVQHADEVVARYVESGASVVVLDVRFGPGPTGLDVARELLAARPDALIVFYSQFDQDEIIREAYRLGGAAFVTKNSAPEALAMAIDEVGRGKTFFLPHIAERLALLGVRGDDSPRTRLEPREVDVFSLMASGLTNVEIAERMSLSPKTISTISQAIKEKLGMYRAADITRLALKHGLIEP